MANRRTKIVFPVFNGYEIRVTLARNIKRTCKRLGCTAAEVAGDLTAMTIPHEDRKICWLVFELKPDAGTVAHECSHAIRALFACIGARWDEEAFAYHLDFLVGRIHKFLRGTE